MDGTVHVPVYCANCGKFGGAVPEEHITFVMYLCNPCCEKWGPIAGTYMEPDAVFFEKLKQAQIEKFGRALTNDELARKLDEGDPTLTKLAREAPRGK